MTTRRTTEFLDGSKVSYEVILHPPAYTAQEVAAAALIPGRAMAKAVVVSIDDQLALAAVPADSAVDLDALQAAVGARSVVLADEADFAHRFEGCRLGAMPPLGVLFGMDTYVDVGLAADEYIMFNAGTHTGAIAMRFGDYLRIARPVLAPIARVQHRGCCAHCKEGCAGPKPCANRKPSNP